MSLLSRPGDVAAIIEEAVATVAASSNRPEQEN